MPPSSKKPAKPAKATEAASARAVPSAVRADILNAALSVFAKHAFEGASLQEIATLAGVGQPLVHYHFGSKDSLWRATVDHALGDLRKFYETVAVTTLDLEPIDVLKVLCRAFVQFSSRSPEHALILINEMRVPGERFEWVVEKYVAPIHHHLDKVLERAVERGQIKPIPAVHVTNTIMITLVHFFTIGPLLKAVYETDATDPQVIAAHANYMIQIIFEGIKA